MNRPEPQEYSPEQLDIIRRQAEELLETAAERAAGRQSDQSPSPPPKPNCDEARISFDWLPELKDGRLVFQVQLTRGARNSDFDIGIELDRLQQPELESVQRIVTRRQNHLSDAQELYASTAWLLEIALRQEGLDKEEREAKKNILLLRNPVSYKEQLIRWQRKRFLLESGKEDFIEGAEDLDCYGEVYRCWQSAVHRLNVGTPELKTVHLREQEELELFFIGLRHGSSVPDTIARQRVLYEKWDSNQDFRDAVAITIQNRHHPDQAEMGLEYHLLCYWLDNHLWLVTNEDRATLLRIYADIQVSANAVQKTVHKLGLKDWSTFQPKGTMAPCYVDRSYDPHTKQELFQILPQN